MADNINFTPGTGVTVATDDVGGIHYQRVKLTHGLDGTATDATTATPLPIAVIGTVPTTVSGTLPVSGPLTDTQLRATAVPISIAGTVKTTPELQSYAYFDYSSAVYTVLASAQNGTSSAIGWIVNPVGSGKTIEVRQIDIQSQLGSALVAVTSPRILVSRFTFGGTPSGATVTESKVQTSSSAASGKFYTATTGMTSPTVGASIWAAFVVASATAVGYNTPSVSIFKPDRPIVLAPGEGIAIWQADAGTALDTRKVVVSVRTAEY